MGQHRSVTWVAVIGLGLAILLTVPALAYSPPLIVNVISGLLVLYAMARFLNLYLTRCLVPRCDGGLDEPLPSREE